MSDHITIGTLDLEEDLVARLASSYAITTWRQRGEPGAVAPPHHRMAAGSTVSASAAFVVISAFADDPALWNATTAPGGVLASLPDDGIHVTIGLHSRTAIDRVDREHERCGRRFVAAPLLLASTPARAAAVLGGAPDALTTLEPIFDVMGISIAARCERPADAALLAIAHSAMVACAMEAIAEAFALVRKFDVDATVLCDVMSDALFAGTLYGPLGNAMLTHATGDVPSAAHGVRMLDLAIDAATRAGVPLASVDACRDRLLSAIARGDGRRGWTVVAQEQARASGLA